MDVNTVYVNLFVKYVHPNISGSEVIQVSEEDLNDYYPWKVQETLYEKLSESLNTSERVLIENIVILGRCEK